MQTESTRKSRNIQSRTKKGSSGWLYGIVAAILLFSIGFYFYLQRSPSRSYSIREYAKQMEAKSDAIEFKTFKSQTDRDKAAETQSSDVSSQDMVVENGTNVKINDEKNKTILAENTNSPTSDALSDTQADILSNQSQNNNSTKTTDPYQMLLEDINSFYGHLDEQEYMKRFQLPEPSKQHFTKVLQKLFDNPPIVTRETDDLFTLLKNTAHFFRVLGKKNIIVLKGILDREKDSFEQTLHSFYTLTQHPEYLQKEYGLTFSDEAIYDYASFFLHTMGGRLYLFRRDSTSRVLVSYYAILVVDRANDAGNSRHGIDIRPAINSLIDEIENGGKKLRLREEYLDTLYDLYEKYN